MTSGLLAYSLSIPRLWVTIPCSVTPLLSYTPPPPPQVAIQSSVALQLLDVPSNVAIMSRSPPDTANGSLTLATYR